MYMKAVPFGAPPDASGPPPKLILQRLTRLHPGMRARWRVADAAIKSKQWRLDLKRWDDEVKPASVRKHREIQAVDPGSLSDGELFAYVARCHEYFETTLVQHHRFTITAALGALSHGADAAGVRTTHGRAAVIFAATLVAGAALSLGLPGGRGVDPWQRYGHGPTWATRVRARSAQHPLEYVTPLQPQTVATAPPQSPGGPTQ